MFLSNSEVSTTNNDISVFSFLVNTERLFEDFINGFVQSSRKELEIRKITPQKEDNLGIHRATEGKSFHVKMDYLIEMNDGRRLIADAKYKRIYDSKTDGEVNYGISNSDVFQMISYSYRKGIDNIYLLYPDYIANRKSGIHHQFDLPDAENNRKIQLEAVTLEILMDYSDFRKDKSVNELFADTENRLREQLKQLLN